MFWLGSLKDAQPTEAGRFGETGDAVGLHPRHRFLGNMREAGSASTASFFMKALVDAVFDRTSDDLRRTGGNNAPSNELTGVD